ncbi:MAG: AAA family ATPase [Balneolaceae bacterium]
MPNNTEKFEFRMYSSQSDIPSSAKALGCLIPDGWDDFGFKTLFSLIVFDQTSNKHDIGPFKIGSFDMQENSVKKALPNSFKKLDNDYFSLGQDDSYYVALGELSESVKNAVLVGLRDVVFNKNLWEQAKKENVTNTSLLRTITTKTVENQYRRLVHGGARLTEYDFVYAAPKRIKADTDRLRLSFSVEPESHPPTNLHVLVGRNGVGKTHILQLMTKSLVAKHSVASQSGEFSSHSATEDENAPIFANLVSVSFSAFDNFELIPENQDSKERIRYSNIGLRRTSETGSGLGTPKSPEMLIREFAKSAHLCMHGMPAKRWKRALTTLESDPIFRALEVAELTSISGDEEVFIGEATTLFRRLSSGHKIVLLTITRLIETVEEQTLVLLDEPEGHLHPPLLSSFVRALSDLMFDRNGVAIIATHSPVVLQEVPRTCVWTLQRSGDNLRAERPELETFGENVGILTREVFGYEVTESGFHKMLFETAHNEPNFDEAVRSFNHELGSEARAILQGLFSANKIRKSE